MDVLVETSLAKEEGVFAMSPGVRSVSPALRPVSVEGVPWKTALVFLKLKMPWETHMLIKSDKIVSLVCARDTFKFSLFFF